VALVTVFSCVLAPKSSFLIADPAMFIEIHFLLFIVKLDGDCNTWRSGWWIAVDGSLDFCCHHRASVHIIGKIFIELF